MLEIIQEIVNGRLFIILNFFTKIIKPTHLSGFIFGGAKGTDFELF